MSKGETVKKTLPCALCPGISSVEKDPVNFPGQYVDYFGEGECQCESRVNERREGLVNELLLSALEDAGYRVGHDGLLVAPKKVCNLVNLLGVRIVEMLGKIR